MGIDPAEGSDGGMVMKVTSVEPESPASRCGALAKGDILVRINGEEVGAESDFGALVTADADAEAAFAQRWGCRSCAVQRAAAQAARPSFGVSSASLHRQLPRRLGRRRGSPPPLLAP